MYFVRWFRHKIKNTTKYSVPITIHSHRWNYAFLKKIIHLITEMEQQIVKAINHIKYDSKKGVTISVLYTKFLEEKKSTTTFDETSLGEIIYKMQQNGKIDDKF